MRVVTKPALMLANRAKPEEIESLQARGYYFDLKIDGVRCFASVLDGHVTLLSRTGQDMTNRYPEIVAPLAAVFPRGFWEFDGELAVLDERGHPSWPLTHKRAAQTSRRVGWASEALPAKFYVFDLLRMGEEDLRHYGSLQRAMWLQDALDRGEDFARRVTAVPREGDGQRLWDFVCEHKLEGIIAKQTFAPYREGRSNAWLKIKRTSTVSCLVGGYDPGEGSRARTFGALHLYLLRDGELVQVGKAGSGFSDRELLEVTALMHEPPLIVEVEYLDVSPEGLLRQPIFQRIRKDLDPSDCTIEQLT